MHPWKTTVVPDLGKFLYDNVHYLHHKSYVTAPWSGLVCALPAAARSARPGYD